MVIPIPWGGLQGLQKFNSLTFNLIINGVLKLLSGICFILLGLGVFGALSAIVLSYIVTTFSSLIMLKRDMPREKVWLMRSGNSQNLNPSYLSEVYHYFLPVGVTLLCFMVLTNIDLILVKHFFRPIEAGHYSIAQMVGKIILFLPVPVVMAMFPKINALDGKRDKMLFTLNRSLGITLMFCGVAILAVFIFPDLILQILSGKVYPECIPLVRFFSINTTILSLILVLLYYHLSTHKRGFLYPLFLFALIQIGSIIFFHQSLMQVLLVVGIVAFCLLIINIYLIYWRKERK
jgi:O-antigen/teichoic acid export membrane protein